MISALLYLIVGIAILGGLIYLLTRLLLGPSDNEKSISKCLKRDAHVKNVWTENNKYGEWRAYSKGTKSLETTVEFSDGYKYTTSEYDKYFDGYSGRYKKYNIVIDETLKNKIIADAEKEHLRLCEKYNAPENSNEDNDIKKTLDNKVKCKYCGTIQPHNRENCYNCGKNLYNN